MGNWSVAQSKETYNIEHWSAGFFDINEKGNVIVYPKGKQHAASIDLYEVARKFEANGLKLPVLLRFPDILQQRISNLRNAFLNAIEEAKYNGTYTSIYPIKVNQQKHVISEILNQSHGYVGLEAGSKPELLAVLALSKPGSTIICNGYKDREFIRLALIGQQMGHHVYIILEKMSELPLIFSESEKLGEIPRIGIRVRPRHMSVGHWQSTGGEKSKFGLSAAQVLEVIDYLRERNKLDLLNLLHFHFGSQISNIHDIQRGVAECARFYAELLSMGAKINVVDVGGGLGIDYDGTHSRGFNSINYTLQEYANNIVWSLQEVCSSMDLPHPDIITESGRALTAHHAVLITNVIESEEISISDQVLNADAGDEIIIRNLQYGYQNITTRTALEAYHDACYWMEEAHSKYIHGILGIEKRGLIEQLYLATCQKVRELLNGNVRSHREVLDELNEKLADKYFANFSIFQSLPDSWAIDQVFPILPIKGLDQEPCRRVILQDITCDSDGCIDHYVDGHGLERTLPLPPYKDHQPYIIGFFLVGAYQEILGDMHNLFGDTDSVNVILTDDNKFKLIEPEYGDLVKDVLNYVHFDCNKLIDSFREQLTACNLPASTMRKYLEELVEGINGYTYFEAEDEQTITG